MTYYKILIITLCCTGSLFINSVNAQSADSTKGVFTGSFNYQSRLHYFGRTDSLKSSGILPIIGYKTKIGIYANSSFIFLENSATPLHYAGTILETGYRLPDNKPITGNIYFEHFIYQPNTLLPQAALKSQAGINSTYNNKIINININADLKFSSAQTDYGVTTGVDKMIVFRNLIPSAVLALDPSFTVYGGTQNYSSTSKLNGILGLPSNETINKVSQQFVILAYESSLNVVIVRGKYNAYFSPSFVVPQNVLSNASNYPKNGLFYISAGFGIRL